MLSYYVILRLLHMLLCEIYNIIGCPISIYDSEAYSEVPLCHLNALFPELGLIYATVHVLFCNQCVNSDENHWVHHLGLGHEGLWIYPRKPFPGPKDYVVSFMFINFLAHILGFPQGRFFREANCTPKPPIQMTAPNENRRHLERLHYQSALPQDINQLPCTAFEGSNRPNK